VGMWRSPACAYGYYRLSYDWRYLRYYGSSWFANGIFIGAVLVRVGYHLTDATTSCFDRDFDRNFDRRFEDARFEGRGFVDMALTGAVSIDMVLTDADRRFGAALRTRLRRRIPVDSMGSRGHR